MERVHYWVKSMLEAGQSPDDLNRIVQEIGRHVGADLSLFFLGSPPRKGKQWFFHHGVEESDIQFYLRHSDDDLYLQHYLSRSLTGNMISLQEMLPLKHINNSWFLEEMIPRLAVRHSMSGLYPIAPGQALAITFHRYCQPFTPENKQVMQKLLQAMVPWSQYFIARDTLDKSYGSASLAKSIMKLPDSLTQAEHHIVSLLAQGYDGSEITAMRGVSKETTKSQIKSILHKTGCRHQNQLLQQIYCGA